MCKKFTHLLVVLSIVCYVVTIAFFIFFSNKDIADKCNDEIEKVKALPEFKKMEDDLRTLKDQEQEFKSQLISAEEAKAKVDQELYDTNEKLLGAENTIYKLNIDLFETMSDLSKLKTENQKLRDENEAEADTLEGEIRDLQNRVKTAEEASGMLRAKLEENIQNRGKI